MESWLKNIKLVYNTIQDYLESKQSNDDELNLKTIFSDYQILKDRNNLKVILHLFSTITKNHNRSNNLFSKIEIILKSLKNEIKNFFSNDQIFNIFRNNKKMLLFLFKEKIINPNKQIFSIISKKNDYLSFFYTEFKSFFSKELIEKVKIEEIDFETYDQKRQIGENDNYISQLIRNDSIDEFIIYVTKNSLYLSSTINSSIYETNTLIIDKPPTLIEYACFFGSIQIFNYLKLNGVVLTPTLWIYAIHGKNPDIIHLLEENLIHIQSVDDCILESIKCHHNEITNYILEKYYEKNDHESDFLIQYIKFYNFFHFPLNLKMNSEVFYHLCAYDYCQIVKLLLNEEQNGFDINFQFLKKRNIWNDELQSFFCYNPDRNIEKHYKEKNTPLIIAIKKGNLEIAENLLQQSNIDLNIKFTSSYAIYQNGKDTGYDGMESKTILFLAAEKGYWEIIQHLINKKDIDVNEINIIGSLGNNINLTALHIAILNEHIQAVKILLESKNIDTNIKFFEEKDSFEKYDKTPLIMAIEIGNSQIVQLLLSIKKTDPNLTYKFYTMSGFADGEDIASIYEELTPLQMATDKNNEEIVQLLLSTKKINVNEYAVIQYNKIQKTALHIAVEKQNYNIVQLLLSYDGIDVNSIARYKYYFEKQYQCYSYDEKKFEQKTALFIAVENENLKIIELLLKQKDINKDIKLVFESVEGNVILHQNKYKEEKKTVMDVAIQKGNVEIINILKEFSMNAHH